MKSCQNRSTKIIKINNHYKTVLAVGVYYNKNKPHSSLGNVTPNEFAMKMALEKLAA